MNPHLADLRTDFDTHAGRSMALPMAGALVWAAIGAAAPRLSSGTANLVLLFGTGAIFPLGLGLARLLGERLIDNPSPLANLMGRCVLMVNLLWAMHLTVFALDPTYLPLTLGIGLGLHWVVFSWVVGHPVGLIHAVLRTVLVTGLWWLVPTHRISAVAAGVVAAYGLSLYLLATRPKNTTSLPSQLPARPDQTAASEQIKRL
jgi:hypothetical protein